MSFYTTQGVNMDARLYVLMYMSDTDVGTHNFPQGTKEFQTKWGPIKVDLERNCWAYANSEFELGRSIRVPESDVMWGPAFVGNHNDHEHLIRCNKVRDEIRNGQLTR